MKIDQVEEERLEDLGEDIRGNRGASQKAGSDSFTHNFLSTSLL